jgi:hypothetical protein
VGEKEAQEEEEKIKEKQGNASLAKKEKLVEEDVVNLLSI